MWEVTKKLLYVKKRTAIPDIPPKNQRLMSLWKKLQVCKFKESQVV